MLEFTAPGRGDFSMPLKELDFKLSILFIEYNRFKFDLEESSMYRWKVQYISVVKKIPFKEIPC